jgi:hypothetical protein
MKSGGTYETSASGSIAICCPCIIQPTHNKKDEAYERLAYIDDHTTTQIISRERPDQNGEQINAAEREERLASYMYREEIACGV